jgi:hypothetical protein
MLTAHPLPGSGALLARLPGARRAEQHAQGPRLALQLFQAGGDGLGVEAVNQLRGTQVVRSLSVNGS